MDIVLLTAYTIAGFLTARFMLRKWLAEFGRPDTLADDAAIGFLLIGAVAFWWAFVVVISLGWVATGGLSRVGKG